MYALDPRPLRAPAHALTLPAPGPAVPAGFPSPAQDYFDGDLDLSALLVPHPVSTYVLQASGHSMTGAGIFDGDRLVVDRGEDPQDGHIVIAVLDGEFTVKRLRVNQAGVTLAAENPAYPDLQVAELSELHIWGVVTWVLHRAARA
ncbi:LexA family protein [Leucobacter sp. HY1910]